MVNKKARSEIVGIFTQIPLKLAYAITIHKSQGQTFNEAIVYPECWDPGQLYTALSRLSDVSGLRLAHHCPDSSLVTPRAVLEFYDSLSGFSTSSLEKPQADTMDGKTS
ncbi:MAG: helicase C-terminal domain-containing protein [Slackia sp.]|nr:helicase C-terminal domain-containing protein [Slackia sp.]